MTGTLDLGSGQLTFNPDSDIHTDGSDGKVALNGFFKSFATLDMQNVLSFSGSVGAIILPDFSAISSPAEGMVGWDYVNHVRKEYDGTAWV